MASSGSLMACSINSLEVQGETLVWHTGLPRGGEQPRTSPPFSYGGRKWCLRFRHRGGFGEYHSIWLHRLDVDGEMEEKKEVLKDPFRVHVHMQHLTQGDKVVGDVEDLDVCGTPTWLWWSGRDSEAIFRMLDWLRDRPEVKFACRFPAPPTIPTDASIEADGEFGRAEAPAEESDTSERRDASIQTDGEFGRAGAPAEGSDTSEKRGIEKLLEDFGQLLVKDDHSDVTLEVGGVSFRAHRAILSARCRPLGATIRHDGASGTVTIGDCEPDVFGQFLRHLYRGSAGPFSARTVFGLYRLADRYLAEDLKSECLGYIQDSLSVQTFCDTVRLALTHGESELLRLSLEFARENLQTILLSTEWQRFICECPREANEILIQSIGPRS